MSLAFFLIAACACTKASAAGFKGDACDATNKCLSSYGCVNGICTDGCTQDSECQATDTDGHSYNCNPAGNFGEGECESIFWHCKTDQQCKDTMNSELYKCTDNTCSAYAGCECDQSCVDDYYGKIITGSICSLVIALVMIIATAVPCCCGVDLDKPICPKVVGGLAICLGIFCVFIPLLASYGAADGATNDTCAKCDGGCTDEQKESIKSLLNALGAIIAYTSGFGFLACIFGPLAAAIGCCTVCPCCGPLKTKIENRKAGVAGQPAGAPATATVMGQPAAAPASA